MRFDADGKLLFYQTARERLRQVEAGLVAISLCATVEEAHGIAKSLNREGNQWRKATKPSHRRILHCEAVIWLIQNMGLLDSITTLAKDTEVKRDPSHRWNRTSPLGYEAMKKAESVLGDWKP